MAKRKSLLLPSDRPDIVSNTGQEHIRVKDGLEDMYVCACVCVHGCVYEGICVCLWCICGYVRMYDDVCVSV